MVFKTATITYKKPTPVFGFKFGDKPEDKPIGKLQLHSVVSGSTVCSGWCLLHSFTVNFILFSEIIWISCNSYS